MADRRTKAVDPLDAMAEAVDRMATGAAGIIDTLHDQSELLRDRPTWKQLVAALLAVVVAIVLTIGYVGWRLNDESQTRGRTTREALTHVVVAAIQCLSGGVATNSLYKCTLDVAEGRRKPPPAVVPGQDASTAPTTTAPASTTATTHASALASLRAARTAQPATTTAIPHVAAPTTTTTAKRRVVTTTTPSCGAQIGSMCFGSVTVPMREMTRNRFDT